MKHIIWTALFLLIFDVVLSLQAEERKSNSFDDFLVRYDRRTALEIHDINDITRTLLEKFNCGSYARTDCHNCLSSAKLQMTGLIGTTVEREEFKNVSIVLLCYIMDLSQFCIVESVPDVNVCYEYVLKQTNNMDTNVFDDFLRKRMKTVYSPDTQFSNFSNGLPSVECIEAKSLINKYRPTSGVDNDILSYETVSQVASDIISSLYNDAPIGCDYPYPAWFIDQLYDSYASNNQFNVNSLVKLMQDMGMQIEDSTEQSSQNGVSGTKKKRARSSRFFRRESEKETYEKCYSAQDLIDIFLLSNDSISKNELTIISPSLIYLQTKGFCETTPEADEQKSRTTDAEKYGYGTAAVLIVSILGLIGVFLLPCFKKSIYEDILTALSALAIGTLFSDAMLHILPVILGLEEENGPAESEHIVIPSYIFRILVAIFAIYFFWLLEVIFYRFTGTHGHSHGDFTNDNSNLIDTQNFNRSELISEPIRQLPSNNQITPTASYGSVTTNSNNNFVFPSVPLAFNPDISVHPLGTKVEKKSLKKRLCCNFKNIKATAWILLCSDAFHNFADGMAIGASFAESTNLGITTTIAIVCHEIPHELGNYAVLVKCGLNHIQALLLNFLSACTCFIGFYVGVSVASDPEVSLWIFSITAGMFFYIALVDLLPNVMFHEKWKWKLFIIVNIFMWIGFSIMFLLVIYEERIKI